MQDYTYPLTKSKIAALKELGETRVYLGREGDFPWPKATGFEPGGMHRLSICVSGYFSLEEDGITYRWPFDLEDRNANGSSYYQIATDRIREVMRKLKGEAKIQFRAWLAETAKAIREKGNEWMGIAERQLSDAAILRDLAKNP